MSTVGMLLDNSLLWLALSLAILVYFLRYIWRRLFSFQGLPKDLPWAGAGKRGALSRGKASCQSLFGLRELSIDGYNKYSKHEQPFVLPNIFTGHEVILPLSQMRWLLEQPDQILSQHEVNKQFLCASHTMLDNKIIGEAHLSNFIHRELTRDLDTHAPAIVDEIDHSLSTNWGTDPTWVDIPLYPVMLNIIGRLVNRVLVGLPLCRDEGYLHSSISFAKYIVLTAGLINLLPTPLRPLLAPLVTFYDTRHFRRLSRIIQPLTRTRTLTFGPGIVFQKPGGVEPNDYIQWALRDAYRHGHHNHDEARERSPEMITKRLAVLGFAAIQSSAITITNALFDIAASEDSISIQQALRLEARTTEANVAAGAWTRAQLAQMGRADSVLRESLRLWGFVNHGVTKAVVAREGVRLPSGELLPYGAKCGVASYGPQRDGRVYVGPDGFEAFRFCREKGDGGASEDAGEKVNSPPMAFVTTGDHYLGFSHGRHACPGRFFASQQLKLLLAHIVMRYDIEPLPLRPENVWLNNTIGPPIGATLRIRRRR